ncbi:MAG TPA: nuclear transport factor 2 family protein [Gemmatimonadaceae bacterium]|nr:nuclear transport factor 2 family protein [Gemmatimonadaceae bacterium]
MTDPREELVEVAHAWDRAMIANDADAIGEFIAEDWIIIGPDGRSSGKASFLSLVRSGGLSHDVMESSDIDVRVYGDAAVLVANGISAGQYEGQRFHEVERQSNVFVSSRGDGGAC